MKKVMKVVVDVLAWVILIAAFLVTVMVFSSSRNNGIASLFGIMPMSVQSDSMAPTFKQGDLILVKKVNDLFSLKEQDVITFYTIIEGNRVLNTHRITSVNDPDGTRNFTTRGDNNPVDDEIAVYPSDIVGKWTGAKIPGGGKVLDFLRSRTGFFVCVVIPMAIFFLFELYKFIAVLIESKQVTITDDEKAEIERQAVEKYLRENPEAAAKLAAAQNAAAQSVTETTEEVKDAETTAE